MAPPADVVLTFASGAALGLFGVLLLFVKPRTSQVTFFSLAAALWGLGIVTANIGRLAVDPDLHRLWLTVSLLVALVMYIFLIHFAMHVRPRPYSNWITGLFAAAALAGLIAYLVDPANMVTAVTLDAAGQIRTQYGSAVFPTVSIPQHLAFVVAVLVLYREYRLTRPGTSRHRIRGILIALAIFPSYQFVRNALAYFDGAQAQFASSSVSTINAISQQALVVAFMGGAIVLAVIAIHAFMRPPPPENRDLPLVLAFAFPAAVAALEDYLFDASILTLETLGFWRLTTVGVLVYTLANYQLFGLDLKIKRFAGPGTAAMIGLFAVPVLLALAQGDFGLRATIITLLPEVIAVGAVLTFRSNVENALFPGVKDTVQYVHQRKLELYKVALEDAIGRGEDVNSRELRDLRVRYEITEQEHQLMTWMAQSSTAAPMAKTQVDTHPGSIVLERYQIVRQIGTGTRRTTFLATDIVSRQYVAVKVVSTKELGGAAARIVLREARLGASISHPNVLAIFDVAELGDSVVIVMDYADDGHLDHHLKKHGPMDLARAVRFTEELLGALAAVHAKGIIHRNLKSQNILLDADGSVLLSDLGAAQLDKELIQTTQSGETMVEQMDADVASAALLDNLYLSPEQATGDPVTAASDLYVAGVLFHRALTGTFYLPIAGRSDVQIRNLIATHEPDLDLDDHPLWVEAFLRRALAKDPQSRYPNAMEMLMDLRERSGARGGA